MKKKKKVWKFFIFLLVFEGWNMEKKVLETLIGV